MARARLVIYYLDDAQDFEGVRTPEWYASVYTVSSLDSAYGRTSDAMTSPLFAEVTTLQRPVEVLF